MSYDECSVADYCSATGTMTIREVDHVKMGRLQLNDEQCINVSLPNRDVRRIERSSGEYISLEGRVFRGSRDATLTSLEINGRRVGLSQCGNFYIFVE